MAEERMIERDSKLMASMLLVLIVLTAPRFAMAELALDIIDGARKEGEVVFYGAVAVNISKRITDLFEKNMA